VSNLGVVLLSQRKREEAERCLRRGPVATPDYEVARKTWR